MPLRITTAEDNPTQALAVHLDASQHVQAPSHGAQAHIQIISNARIHQTSNMTEKDSVWVEVPVPHHRCNRPPGIYSLFKKWATITF